MGKFKTSVLLDGSLHCEERHITAVICAMSVGAACRSMVSHAVAALGRMHGVTWKVSILCTLKSLVDGVAENNIVDSLSCK